MIPASPTPRLLAGLAATLALVAGFSAYSLHQIEGVRRLQTDVTEKNRRDALELLRIQSNLSELGLAARDMTDPLNVHPLTEWRKPLQRIREDLADAVRTERTLARRPDEQNAYIRDALNELWSTVDAAMAEAAQGGEERARQIVAVSLAPQQAALSGAVGKLLLANREAEDATAREIHRIYDQAERDVYIFMALMMMAIAAIGLGVAYHNRELFGGLTRLAEQRSTLARRLIGVQEEVFKSVARELHDEFGQILTAIAVMLRRMQSKQAPPDSELYRALTEVREITQDALEKTRSFSQALHPTILDDYGLWEAVERYVAAFSKQSGIPVALHRAGSAPVEDTKAIHVYRVLQEALTNVSKHSKATAASVHLSVVDGNLRLEVRDNGVGVPPRPGHGLGLVAMRERAELVGGTLRVKKDTKGGTLVQLDVPAEAAG